MDPTEQSGVPPVFPSIEPTPLQEAALEALRRHTWPDEDLTMDLEPYPDSQVY